MAYKCSICQSNDVDNAGDICELCAIGQDPYAAGLNANSNNGIPIPVNHHAELPQNAGYIPHRGTSRKVLLNGGTEVSNCDPYGNNISSAEKQTSQVQVYAAGSVPATQPKTSVLNSNSAGSNGTSTGRATNQPVSTGVIKNLKVDNQPRGFFSKWFCSLFKGAPFSMGNEITMFQVFPDYSGTSRNASGNACDQILVYGKINSGSLSENNDVEVYGRRDSCNNVIAKKIINRASGTIITPTKSVGSGFVWTVTLSALFLVIGSIASAISGLGIGGVMVLAILCWCVFNFKKTTSFLGKTIKGVFSLLKKLFC